MEQREARDNLVINLIAIQSQQNLVRVNMANMDKFLDLIIAFKVAAMQLVVFHIVEVLLEKIFSNDTSKVSKVNHQLEELVHLELLESSQQVFQEFPNISSRRANTKVKLRSQVLNISNKVINL